MIQAMVNRMRNGANDDIYTPDYAVLALVPFLDPSLTYWECCDNGSSRIASVLRAKGFKVVATTKEQLDFLKGVPSFQFDCVITNPPYSNKDDFIKRCVEIGKPSYLLMPLTALEGVNRGRYYRSTSVGLYVLDRRVSFLGYGKSNWFNTSWFVLNSSSFIRFLRLDPQLSLFD